jgi:hypothetical protein
MGEKPKNFWKDRLYNRNVRKRFLYIYAPVAIALFITLNVAGVISNNSDSAALALLGAGVRGRPRAPLRNLIPIS